MPQGIHKIEMEALTHSLRGKSTLSLTSIVLVPFKHARRLQVSQWQVTLYKAPTDRPIH
jgi:hypothetical protein